MRFTQSSVPSVGGALAHKASALSRQQRRRTAILSFLFAAAVVFLSLAGGTTTSAQADEVGAEYSFTFSGNVKETGTALEGVRITVSGNGYEAETVTDAQGQWRIGVPEKATYTITLDESTLPAGVIVAEGTPTVDAEFGLSGDKSVNFFLGAGERVVVSFSDQLISRFFDGINF
jgi:neutral amino acid transport system permease protein